MAGDNELKTNSDFAVKNRFHIIFSFRNFKKPLNVVGNMKVWLTMFVCLGPVFEIIQDRTLFKPSQKWIVDSIDMLFISALPAYSLYSSRQRNLGSWLQRDSVNVWNLIIISGISELTGSVNERTLGPQNWILPSAQCPALLSISCPRLANLASR